MGKTPKQIFCQRRHTDGQQAHEKMSDIANYQRNANQKYNEAPPHICQNGNHSKVYSSKCLGECGEKEPSHIVDGNVHWCNHYGKNMEAPLKTKNRVAV